MLVRSLRDDFTDELAKPAGGDPPPRRFADHAFSGAAAGQFICVSLRPSGNDAVINALLEGGHPTVTLSEGGNLLSLQGPQTRFGPDEAKAGPAPICRLVLRPWAMPCLFAIEASSLVNASQRLGGSPRHDALKAALAAFALGHTYPIERLTSEWAASSPACDPQLAAAIDLIEAGDGLATINAIARHLGVSARHVRRLFEPTGVSPKLYAKRRRLREAVIQALNPRHGWKDVAAAAGYSDQAHLCRDFTRAFGCSPARVAPQIASLGAPTAANAC